MPIPVAARSKGWIISRTPDRITGSNPAEASIFASFECCVLSGRGLCDELITRTEDLSFLLSVIVVPQ
jgi:hypothetical protein